MSANNYFKGLLEKQQKTMTNACNIPEEFSKKLKAIAKECDTNKDHLIRTILIDFAKNWEQNKQLALEEQIQQRNKIFAKEKIDSKVIPEI